MGWSEWKNLGGDINCIANNYDPNEEYDTENNPYCLIDDLLYKVLEDGVTGPLDMTKWKRAYLTDNIHTNSNSEITFDLECSQASNYAISSDVYATFSLSKENNKFSTVTFNNISIISPSFGYYLAIDGVTTHDRPKLGEPIDIKGKSVSIMARLVSSTGGGTHFVNVTLK